MVKTNCEFCKKFNFDSVCIGYEGDAAKVYLALCNTKFPKEKQFKFCPNCGKAIQTKGKQ